jgi:hypothetical protein
MGYVAKKRRAHSRTIDTKKSFQLGCPMLIFFVTMAAMSLSFSIPGQKALSNVLETVTNVHSHVWKEEIHTTLTDAGNEKWVVDLNQQKSIDFQGPISLHDFTASTHPQGLKTLSAVEKFSTPTQESDKETKPWLILHIGPPKTGTTSIQCGLQQYSQHLKELDNYFYMGIRCSHGRPSRRQNRMPNNETAIHGTSLAYYMNGMIEQTHEVYHIFQRLNQLREQGYNVIISSEHLFTATPTKGSKHTDVPWGHFKSLISGFKVKAVVVNRLLLDWLPSNYYQMFYSTKKGGIPSFQSFLESALMVLEDKEGRDPYHDLNVLAKLKVWSRHFDLDVMDFYGEPYQEDIFQNFICHHTPDADRTCEFLTNEKQELLRTSEKVNKLSNHARVSGSLQPLRSFFYAIEKYGEFENSSTTMEYGSRYLYLKNASRRVNYRSRYIKNAELVFEEHHVLSNLYYLDCISADLEAKLKNYSTILMQTFYEEKHGRPMKGHELVKNIGRQREVFEKNMALGKYCDLNLERLFRNDSIASALMDF